MFRLCAPLTQERVHHLVLWAVNAFPTLGMCDYPYPADFMAPLPAWPVTYACDNALLQPTPLDALREVAGLMYNGTSGTLKVRVTQTTLYHCSCADACFAVLRH